MADELKPKKRMLPGSANQDAVVSADGRRFVVIPSNGKSSTNYGGGQPKNSIGYGCYQYSKIQGYS